MNRSPIDQKPERRNLLLKDFKKYVVPIISVLIFIVIIAFAIIPLYLQTVENSRSLKSRREEIDSQQILVSELEQLAEESVSNSELIDMLDGIIPATQTEVVAFQRKVSVLAEQNSVDIEEVVVGEKILVNTGGQEQINISSALYIVQIPIQFKLVGQVPDFQGFLNDIYSSGDFIIVTQMSLVNRDFQSDTVMDITLSKYQFLPIDRENEELLLLIDGISHKAEMSPSVLKFIQRKYSGF
jgi:Tfp pilus assembly protein PilO